jgi:tRNA G10  N-methylase Trm11
MKFRYIFGNAPELARAELEAVLKTHEESPELIKILGGTVKIAQVLPEDVKLSDIITSDFGISDYTGKANVVKLCKGIKDETGKRFVLPKTGKVLSSVVVAKQKLIEIIIGDGWMGKTVTVQDFEDWAKRDFGRPEADPHIGMLPPKVARMMVNIALPTTNYQLQTIFDPFCGVGTILAEALMVGCQVIGNDINKTQIEKTKRNLDWLVSSYKLQATSYELRNTDARQLARLGRVDAIVTEPDLGLSVNDAPRLEKLYTECFLAWKDILNPGGSVVIALPHFVKNVVDKVKNIGYSLVQGPYEYSRPNAIIKRNIWHMLKPEE